MCHVKKAFLKEKHSFKFHLFSTKHVYWNNLYLKKKKKKKNPTFGGWTESFQSFVNTAHQNFREFMLAGAKDRRNGTSPPLCHTHTLFSTPTFHFWINHEGAERGAQELLCTWDSLCALAQWYLCQIVRCVAWGHTRVIPDRKQNKALAMWGEVKRGTVATSCVSVSVWGCWDTVQSHRSVTEEHQERDGFHPVALDLNPWRPGQGNGQGHISPADEAETQLKKERDKVVQYQSRAGTLVSPVAPTALLWENT